MSTTKKQPTPNTGNLFDKQNYLLMLAGVVVMAIGFLLMSGGKSPDPTKFNDAEIYSTTRITIAPALIVIGLIIEIVAIMKKPRQDSQQ